MIYRKLQGENKPPKLLWCVNAGGRYASQYIKKARKGVICGDCKEPLAGVSPKLVTFVTYIYIYFASLLSFTD